MVYKTRDFGEIEIADSDIYEMVQPPFGFEEYNKFAFIRNHEVGDQIAWLQSIDDPRVCFILFDPSHLSSFYKPVIPENATKMLGEDELVCWVIGVVPEKFENTTVNLKSPIILNMQARKGAQIILDDDYPVRYVFMQEGK